MEFFLKVPSYFFFLSHIYVCKKNKAKQCFFTLKKTVFLGGLQMVFKSMQMFILKVQKKSFDEKVFHISFLDTMLLNIY